MDSSSQLFSLEAIPGTSAILDHQGKIKCVNQRYLEVTGFSAEEMLAVPLVSFWDFSNNEIDLNLKRLVHPEIWRGYIRHRKKDGSLYQELVVISKMVDEESNTSNYLKVGQPTELSDCPPHCPSTPHTSGSSIVETLKQSEEGYLTILDVAPFSIVVTRISDAQYVLVNSAFCKRTGYGKAEIIGKSARDFNFFRDRAEEKHFVSLLRRHGKVDRMELDFQDKNGRRLQAMSSARVIRFEGNDCVLTIIADISDLKAAQKALMEREESYRSILQVSPYSITISRLSDGKYLEVNNFFCRFCGYRREEIIGRTYRDLNIFVDKQIMKKFLKSFEEKGRISDMEIEFQSRNGDRFHSLLSARIIQYKGEHCVLAISTNITALKKTQKALQESEERFRTIFETAADPIFLNEMRYGRFLDVNHAACRHLGYSKSEILKLSMTDIQNSRGFDPIDHYNEHKTLGDGLFFESMHVRQDGSKAIVEVSSKEMTHQGRPVLLSLVRDITQRKKNEQELERYRENLEQMVAERTQALENAQNELVKQEKLAVLGQLTATVSHELRNPLAVIRSSNYYLQHKIKEKDEKTDKHFKRIDEQISHCDAIVEELLEYTRGRSVSVIVQDIAPWITKEVEQIREETQIEIRLELNHNILPIAHDQEKLRRVLINLLNNSVQAVSAQQEAVKYKEKNREYLPKISVQVYPKDNKLYLTVDDNGIGMDEKTRQRAFEPLFTTRARGTGIGLANVKKIVEEHGGTIDLATRQGEGTKITLSLPYHH